LGWTLYIVRCRDGSLYTGITNDLTRRLSMHDAGKGARYTRGRGPVELVYREACADRAGASQREWAVKQLPVAGKRALVAAGGVATADGKRARRRRTPRSPR
jgi:putative endonuclease